VHFEAEHGFAGTVEQVATLMSDPAFQTMLDLPDLARPDVVAHEVDGSVRRLTLRYEYIGQLDPIAQKVVGGRKLVLRRLAPVYAMMLVIVVSAIINQAWVGAINAIFKPVDDASETQSTRRSSSLRVAGG